VQEHIINGGRWPINARVNPVNVRLLRAGTPLPEEDGRRVCINDPLERIAGVCAVNGCTSHPYTPGLEIEMRPLHAPGG